MKLPICILKHGSVLSLSISCLSPLSFSFVFFSFAFSFPEDNIASTSFLSFQLGVCPPCVTEHQRQPAGMYFSYLSDLYFSGRRGLQWRVPCLTSGFISPLIVLDGVLPFSQLPTKQELHSMTFSNYSGRVKKNQTKQEWTQAGNQPAKEIDTNMLACACWNLYTLMYHTSHISHFTLLFHSLSFLPSGWISLHLCSPPRPSMLYWSFASQVRVMTRSVNIHSSAYAEAEQTVFGQKVQELQDSVTYSMPAVSHG